MSDLISREASIDFIEERSGSFGITVSNKCNFKEIVKMMKPVDAVEVVRCRECIHHTDEEPGMVYCPAVMGGWVGNEFYCADGERKEVSDEET